LKRAGKASLTLLFATVLSMALVFVGCSSSNDDDDDYNGQVEGTITIGEAPNADPAQQLRAALVLYKEVIINTPITITAENIVAKGPIVVDKIAAGGVKSARAGDNYVGQTLTFGPKGSLTIIGRGTDNITKEPFRVGAAGTLSGLRGDNLQRPDNLKFTNAIVTVYGRSQLIGGYVDLEDGFRASWNTRSRASRMSGPSNREAALMVTYGVIYPMQASWSRDLPPWLLLYTAPGPLRTILPWPLTSTMTSMWWPAAT
jgi:hypothetical protein